MLRAFKPTTWATASLAVTNATGSVALNSPPGSATFQVRIHNAGTGLVFVKGGSSSVTAAVTDLPIPAGVVEVLTVQGVTHLAAITASGTATIYATVGEGI